jgi:methyl-accepting chemotaxis protein
VLARRTRTQAGTLEETGDAMQQMSGQLAQAATHAELAGQLAQCANSFAARGGSAWCSGWW